MINLTWWKKSTSNQPMVEASTKVSTMEDNIVIRGLDFVIDFLEASIMRLSLILLWVGAVMGTVAILTPQFQLSSIPGYNLVWAIVQALALDGLFVGVLFILRDNWKVYDRWSKVWYGGIAFLLGIVATLINCTLAYQEVNQISSVVDAMNKLGISQVNFSYTRAILVVIVTALVCTLPRQRKIEPIPDSIEMGGIRAEISEIRDMLYTICPPPSLLELPQPSTKDKIKDYLVENPTAKNKDIAQALDLSPSTVKSYAASIRKELVS